jgi:4-diphosphocytidyl-2-C-methyl-D-erythritol kinase
MPTQLEKQSPCKVNLLLNILGKRPDGFHELETVMHHVRFYDQISFKAAGGVRTSQIQFTCSDATLPVDSKNLVYRAAEAFATAAGVKDAIDLHLEKKIPHAAGLGGGSGNAATTLLGLNELFGAPLDVVKLHELASGLGSDIPFFLQSNPAVATGRGEKVRSLKPLKSLEGMYFFLVRPGFGISTPWAYQNLARFPEALNGKPGRAETMICHFEKGDNEAAFATFYNSLEAPALDKYPILKLYQEHMMTHGASVALMSGSGSTTFAIVRSKEIAEKMRERFLAEFGETCWSAIVGV